MIRVMSALSLGEAGFLNGGGEVGGGGLWHGMASAWERPSPRPPGLRALFRYEDARNASSAPFKAQGQGGKKSRGFTKQKQK